MSERDYLKGWIKAKNPCVNTKGKSTSWLRGYINASMNGIRNIGNSIRARFGGSIFGGRQVCGGPAFRPGFGHHFFGGHPGHVGHPGPHPEPHPGCGHRFNPYFG